MDSLKSFLCPPAKQGTLTSDITLPVCESKFSVTETISKMLAQAEKTCLIKVEDMLKAESFAKTFALLKKKKAVRIVHQYFVSVQPIGLNLTLVTLDAFYHHSCQTTICCLPRCVLTNLVKYCREFGISLKDTS